MNQSGIEIISRRNRIICAASSSIAKRRTVNVRLSIVPPSRLKRVSLLGIRYRYYTETDP